MDKMTLEEVVSEYKDIVLSFSSYYKFCFYFRGVTPEGHTILASLGGNSEDIYRVEVVNNDKRTLGDTVSKCNGVHIRDAVTNEKIFTYSNY